MAPPPVQVIVKTKVYNIQLINGDMENIFIQMEANKEEMNRSRQRLNDAKAEYDANCNTLLLIYIQQTGQYPE